MSITCVGGRLGGTGLGAIAILLLHAGGQPLLAQQPNTAATPAVTFARDVAPILQKNCQECHQPGAIGPMSLRTYEEVRPWARAIKQRVVAREMPPYRYDKVGIQHLKDDLRLSEADIQTIARWVDNGAPLGNPADLPPPVQFPDGASGRSRTSSVRRISSSRPSLTRFRPRDRIAGGGRSSPSARRTIGASRRLAVKPSLKGRAGRAPRQQRPAGPRREDRAVRRCSSASPSTRPARSARSFRRMPAGRFRPTR